MTYDALTTASETDAWRRRVQGSLVAAAVAITVDSPTAGLETRRDALAREILREPALWTGRFALAVALGFLAGADLTNAVTDTQVDTRVASVFNDFLA
jgi:hypothetical protein